MCLLTSQAQAPETDRRGHSPGRLQPLAYPPPNRRCLEPCLERRPLGLDQTESWGAGHLAALPRGGRRASLPRPGIAVGASARLGAQGRVGPPAGALRREPRGPGAARRQGAPRRRPGLDSRRAEAGTKAALWAGVGAAGAGRGLPRAPAAGGRERLRRPPLGRRRASPAPPSPAARPHQGPPQEAAPEMAPSVRPGRCTEGPLRGWHGQCLRARLGRQGSGQDPLVPGLAAELGEVLASRPSLSSGGQPPPALGSPTPALTLRA